MSKSIYYSIAASAAILLSACGDDITEVTEINEVGMKVIEKGEALPKCTSDNEGALAYSVDSALAYYCVNRQWKTLNGKDGADGKDGVDGKDGDKGEQGEQGIKGDKGDTGEKGDQGEKGDKGDTGEKGADASSTCTVEPLADSSGFKMLCDGDSVGVVLNGKDGADGKDGDKGEKGDQGEKGDTGEKGDKGDKGDTGAKGDQGASCTIKQLTNQDGYKVLCGGDSVGVILNGEKGEKGDQGIQGIQGPRGLQGIQGEQGEQGEKGDKGSSCHVVDEGHGVLTMACTDGKSGRSFTFYKALCGTTPYDPEEIAPVYCNDGDFYMKDTRDGQRYRVITIGSQTWMAENLNYAATSPSYCYNGKLDNCTTYGRLYPANSLAELCPSGWHVPQPSEFSTLFTNIGAPVGTKLKSTKGWADSGNGTDDFGFTLLPGGTGIAGKSSLSSNTFVGDTEVAHLWTSLQTQKTTDGETHVITYFFVFSSTSNTYNFSSVDLAERILKSVRCVKD